MKTLFLLRGLPGAGKTTVVNLLSEDDKYPILSADVYFETITGRYDWNVSKIKEAHSWCRHECMALMADLRRFINYPNFDGIVKDWDKSKIFVANTFTQEWEMEDYFKLAEKYGYQVVTMIVENRHGSKNIHDVPEETIEKMKNRFQIKL